MGAETKLPLFNSGKVRDTYEIPGHPDLLLVIASDRLSTHNVKHLTPIPGKGELLTALTVFWLMKVMQDIPNHIVAYGRKIYEYLPPQTDIGHYRIGLHYRAVVVRKLDMILVEFVWRNFLTGSLEAAYLKGKDPYGLKLPPGLPKMHRFAPEMIFTPTDKSETDEPLRSSYVMQRYNEAFLLTGLVFDRMTDHLATRGITLIDSKMEVGNGPCLADEWGTGDCSRMAWTKDVKEGVDPPWLDKEIARQIAIKKWAGGPKVPLTFTPEEIEQISRGYHTAFKGITGLMLGQFKREYLD